MNETEKGQEWQASKAVSEGILNTLPRNEFNKPDFTKINSANSILKGNLKVGEVLIFGDIHGTDRKSSIHVDYEEDTINVFTHILQMVRTRKPSAVVLAGDLIGINKDKNVKTLQFQAFVHMTLRLIADEVNGELYITLGNHDEGTTLTDTQYFLMTGVLRNTDYLDIGDCRIHLINYGEENRVIDIKDGGYNVAVAHNEFHVGRETNWFFNSAKSFELDKMMNFKGIDYLLVGHIHKPSPYPVTTSIGDKNITLFYLGCPTRPRVTDNYSYVHVVSVIVNESDVRLEHIRWDLPEKRFLADAEEKEMSSLIESLEMLNISDSPLTKRQQDLSAALTGLTEYGLIGDGQDFYACLNMIGVMDKEALNLVTTKLEEYASGNKSTR